MIKKTSFLLLIILTIFCVFVICVCYMSPPPSAAEETIVPQSDTVNVQNDTAGVKNTNEKKSILTLENGRWVIIDPADSRYEQFEKTSGDNAEPAEYISAEELNERMMKAFSPAESDDDDEEEDDDDDSDSKKPSSKTENWYRNLGIPL